MNRYENLNLEELRALAIHFGGKLSQEAYSTRYGSIADLMVTVGEIGQAMRKSLEESLVKMMGDNQSPDEGLKEKIVSYQMKGPDHGLFRGGNGS